MEPLNGIKQNVEEAAAYVAARLPQPEMAVVLGSGLGGLTKLLENAQELDYAQIPHFPPTTVAGHSGKLAAGRIAGKSVYMLSGRFHYYEGHDPHTVILPMRMLKQLGCKALILTNAAGGVNLEFKAGELMLITDHINLTGYNPLRGANSEDWGPRFPDMTHTYDPGLAALARNSAAKHGFTLREGVYCGLAGPSFETPAEIRMLRLLGADAVGMSTVPEALAAHQMGLRLLAISCVSNMAAGVTDEKLTHEMVFENSLRAEAQFMALIPDIAAGIGP